MKLRLIIYKKFNYIQISFIAFLLITFGLIEISYAIPTISEDKNKLPVILKAKTIDGDKDQQIL